ncbi:MAG: hypothetical protein ACODAQ_07130, partial [Phycisphaeraceae bacterium]
RPDAYVIIRFPLHASRQWMEDHPEQMFVTEQGERLPHASLASQAFWEKAAAVSAAVIEYGESRPWADRVIGYANYHVSEGTHPPAIHQWQYDHSPVMRRRWRAYLRERYETVEALREAHGDDSLTFENAPVPSDPLNGRRRDVAAMLHWQGAADNQPLRDYLLLMRDLYHENFRRIASASRAAAGTDKLLVHDTFKLPMQGWALESFFLLDRSWPMVYPELLAASGNMDVAALTEAPGFDGLVTPYDYQTRGAGGVFQPEGIADSMVLRGKLFMTEYDLRTYLVRSRYGSVRDMAEFAAVTWRDLAEALTRGFANYYCDHNADYHAEPEMHRIIARQVEVIHEALDWQHETVPGIAVVLDDRAALETSGSGHVMHETVQTEWRTGVSRSGVPYRIYLFDDLTLDNFPEHRVFYFPNLYRVDEHRMAVLRRRVLRDGNVVVWGPGSGISDGERIGAASAARLTGFDFDLHEVNYPRRVQITNFDHPITRDLAPDTILGSSIAYGPVLYPTDGTRLGLAWSQQGDDDTGLAVKSFGGGARGAHEDAAALGAGDYAAVFSTTAPLSADLWRGIARFAGAHIYSETNDIVLASRHLVALHSLKSGERTLRLPGAHRVTDLINDELVHDSSDVIRFEVDAPATHLFHIEPVE